MFKVFVYGTLKQAFPNEHLNHGVHLKGDYLTKESYPLYLVGERQSVWLMMEQGQGTRIKGQLFELDPAALAVMDQLERVDQADGYQRQLIQVVNQDTGEQIEAFVYMKAPSLLNQVDIQKDLKDCYTLDDAKGYISRK